MQIDVTDLLGVKYKKNGRDLNGLDCYGLIIEVSKRFGHTLRDFEYEDTSYKTFETIIGSVKPEQEGIKLVSKPSKEGDIILFKVKSCFENHCGVYLGDGYFIHCNIYGVHIESLDDYSCEIGSVYQWL